MSTHEERFGGFLLLGTCVIEGLTPILAHMTSDIFPPFLFLASSAIIAASVLFVVLLFQRVRWSDVPLSGVVMMCGVGLLIFTSFAMIFIGTRYTSGINTALLTQVEMPFALLVSVFLFGEHVHRHQWLGASIVFVGTILILYGGALSLNRGDLLILLAAAIFPFANLLAKKALTMLTSFMALFIRYVFVGCVFFVVSAYFENNIGMLLHLTTEQFWLLAVYSIIVLIGSKTFWYEGLRRLSIGRATAIISAFPAFSLVFAYLLLRELPTWYQLTGGVLAFIGVMLLIRPGKLSPCSDLV